MKTWKKYLGFVIFGSIICVPAVLYAYQKNLIQNVFGLVGILACLVLLTIFASHLINSNKLNNGKTEEK